MSAAVLYAYLHHHLHWHYYYLLHLSLRAVLDAFECSRSNGPLQHLHSVVIPFLLACILTNVESQ